MEGINKNKVIFSLIFISVLPFLALIRDIYSLGNVFGLIGLTMLMWQLTLGNRFIIKLISPDYATRIKLHKFLGIYGSVFVFAHPLLQLSLYGTNLLFSLDSNYMWGKLAFGLFIFVWITSALIRRKMPYRMWLYFHYLNYVTISAVFLHAGDIGTFINTNYAVGLYFSLLKLIFAILIIWRLAIFMNFNKPKFELKKKWKNKNGISLYTFSPKNKKLLPQIGQFFYIRINRFGEARPFTITNFDEKSGDLVFGVKAVGRFTNQLETMNVGDEVYMDGPYGIFTNEGQNENPKVIIAGGIGVTPFVELIKRFGNEKTYMFYANRELNDAIYRDMFKTELGANYTDIISQEKVTNEPVVSGRISKEILVSKMNKKFIASANFFVCGSPAFMQSVKQILKELKVSQNKTYFEDFGF